MLSLAVLGLALFLATRKPRRHKKRRTEWVAM